MIAEVTEDGTGVRFVAENAVEGMQLGMLGGKVNSGSLEVGVFSDTGLVGEAQLTVSAAGIVDELTRGIGSITSLGESAPVGAEVNEPVDGDAVLPKLAVDSDAADVVEVGGAGE